jgi:hypothetical protein
MAPVDLLQDLLRAEINAAEAYAQAVERLEGKPESTELRALRDGHLDLVTRLRRITALVEELRASGSRLLGPKGDGASTPAAQASLVKTLEDLERSGRQLCVKALENAALDPDVRRLLAGTVLPRHDDHLARLRALASKTR